MEVINWPYTMCVYAYDNGKFKVISLFKTAPAACRFAEEQIRKICDETGSNYEYNGKEPAKAYIANKDGKILAARLVKRVAV